MSNEEITITVKEWDDDFNVYLTDFIAELQGILESIPAEHRVNASIDFDRSGSDYDYSRGELSVQYSRPKTAEELDSERKAKEASARYQADEERRQYDRLKAKFEKNESGR